MKKSILVTGAHRSGSTWIGKIIAKADNVRYVSEPFNLLDYKKSTPFKHWFYYINDKFPIDQQNKLKKYLDSFHYFSLAGFIRDFSKIRSYKTFIKVMNDYRSRSSSRTLLKDPIAFFSAPWIAQNYHCDVIISVRHPAAFIASLKVKNWQFDFNNFLNQRELMETHLAQFKTEIEQYALNRPDIVIQGALIWNIIYSLALKYKELYNNWYFVTHENLSLNPVDEFQKIFNYLNLEFTEKVKNELIDSTTASENSKLKRNAKENVSSWKTRLSQEEIELIKQKTQLVWVNFYNEASWS